MSQHRRLTAALISTLLVASFAMATVAPARVLAITGIEPSDVVLVFDFSTSMQDDGKNLDTATALETIADRIPGYSNDLLAHQVSVHLVWFRGDAAPVPGCGEITMTAASQVDLFAKCLNQVASHYRAGVADWKKNVGSHYGTNYEAAFNESVQRLVSGSTKRPAIVFFTDGDHTGQDSDKVPSDTSWLARIKVELTKLTDKAVLPVGLGVKDRALHILEDLRDQTTLRGCPDSSGQTALIEWPKVKFANGIEAGDAVATAFASVTCVSLNVNPPPPTAPGAPEPPNVAPGDGSATVKVAPPASDGGAPVSGYQHECTATTSGETIAGTGNLPEATVSGLQNGEEYRCRSAAINAVGTSPWSDQSGPVTPCSGLLGCNPWLIPLLLLLLLLALLALIALAIWLWRQRTRGYVVATVAGFPQVSLLRGPNTGMSFVSNTDPSQVDGLRRDIQSNANLGIENLGGGRFKWSDRVSGQSGIAEPGQSFTVTDPAGSQREVKLRAFGGRPKNIPTTISLTGSGGTATWGSGGGTDAWGGGGGSGTGWG